MVQKTLQEPRANVWVCSTMQEAPLRPMDPLGAQASHLWHVKRREFQLEWLGNTVQSSLHPTHPSPKMLNYSFITNQTRNEVPLWSYVVRFFSRCKGRTKVTGSSVVPVFRFLNLLAVPFGFPSIITGLKTPRVYVLFSAVWWAVAMVLMYVPMDGWMHSRWPNLISWSEIYAQLSSSCFVLCCWIVIISWSLLGSPRLGAWKERGFGTWSVPSPPSCEHAWIV